MFTESRVPNHKIQYYILSFIVKYDSLNIIYNPIYVASIIGNIALVIVLNTF